MFFYLNIFLQNFFQLKIFIDFVINLCVMYKKVDKFVQFLKINKSSKKKFEYKK